MMASLNDKCQPARMWFCLFVVLITFLGRVAANGHEIIVIEKAPTGLFVGTSENYYAFTHPELSELSWHSVSVGDNEVFIVKQDNSTSMILWDELEESSRDFISDLRSDFISNLAPLKLTYLPPPTVAKLSKGYRYELATGNKSRRKPAIAGNNQQLLRTYKCHKQAPKQQITGTYSGSAAADCASGNAKAEMGMKKPSTKYPTYDYSDYDGADSEWPQPVTGFNYYNLNSGESGKKLAGDVYHFDMSGNILDVFSSTISIKLDQPHRKTSILYRDKRFFSYSGRSLPLTIRRLFVQGEFAFFVFRDSTVLAKPMHSLNSREKKLVKQVSAHVKKLYQWQTPSAGYTFALPEMILKEATESHPIEKSDSQEENQIQSQEEQH